MHLNSSTPAHEALQTLKLIVTNCSSLPNVQKYRLIRARGAAIGKLLNVHGGPESLVMLGAVKSIKDFEAFYSFPITAEVQEMHLQSIEIINTYIAELNR